MRKVFYNQAITLMSVAIALVISASEALNLIGDELDLLGRF